MYFWTNVYVEISGILSLFNLCDRKEQGSNLESVIMPVLGFTT